MNIHLVSGMDKPYNAYVIPVFEDNISIYEKLSKEQTLLLQELMRDKEFTGKKGSVLSCEMLHQEKLVHIRYIGLGKQEKLKPYEVIESFYKGLKELKGSVVIGSEGVNIQHIVEAIYYANYQFDKYKHDKKEEQPKPCFDIVSNKASTEELEKGIALAESTLITRNLVNEPANVIFPESLAAQVEELGKSYGFEVEVLQEEAIQELKMEAFLSVARAAEKRPRLIVMRYMGDPEHADTIEGLVGKGLTYDTGGLSLKPTPSMVSMKSDMGGAATVIGTICSLARLQVKRNVVAVVAACENSIGGNAYRPGDIINSMAGKTIEIGNTDAEGRLTLADAVYYTVTKERATEVIDVATLTGAVSVALGDTTTGVITNREQMYQSLEAASLIAGERVWQLPSFPEYQELYKSKIADLKNVGGRSGGTITAGMFIGEFVQETPWMHLDIAGTSYAEKPYGYYTAGGTGQIVRTLVEYYLAK